MKPDDSCLHISASPQGPVVARAILDGSNALRAARGRQHSFPGVSDREWYDWRWQFRNRVTSLERLAEKLRLPTPTIVALRGVLREFRMGITPYYLSLFDPDD